MSAEHDPGMDTPLSPFPDPQEVEVERAGDHEGFWSPIQDGLRYLTSAWRVLLIVLGFHLILGLTVVLPFQSALGARLDTHAHAPALAGEPDAYDVSTGWDQGGIDYGIWSDFKRLDASLLDTQRITLFWVALIAWLFGALVNGGYLGTAMEPLRRVSFTNFLIHGGRHFGRMLRVGLVFAVTYYIVARVVLEVWAGAVEPDEQAASSSSVGWWNARIREGVMVLAFLWLRVAADLARADMVAFGRSSAAMALLRGFGRTLRHPVRTFGLALVLGLPAFGLILALSFLVDWAPGEGWIALLVMFVVIELAVLLRLASRAAVLVGDVRLVLATQRA